MPIYEFRCDECGTRFEVLVAAGTPTHACRSCDAAAAARVLSSPAEPSRLVGTGRQQRRQEDRNRGLRESAKRSFKEKRNRARQAAQARRSGGET